MQAQRHAPARAHRVWSLLADRGVRLVLVAFALIAWAALNDARAADDFLEPEKAFQFSATAADAKSVAVDFTIAPGYYLYREQFKFAASGAKLGTPAIPPGKVKFDETFQKNVETYRDHIRIVVPVEEAGAEFRLVVTSQGCADAGLCYPPMQSAAAIGLAGFGGAGTARVEAPGKDGGATSTASTSLSTAPATTSAQEATGVEVVLRGGAAEKTGFSANDEWIGIELPTRKGQPTQAWRITKIEDLALYLGPQKKMIAIVARDRRLLRLPLTLPTGVTTWRLFAKDAALTTKWLTGS